jgi:general secretion pathway protein G
MAVKMLNRLGEKGFTLLELMIVIAIIGILATLAQPSYKTAVKKSREAALKENLYNIRSVLDQYYADNGKYPDSLDDVVTKGYMRGVPVDPITNSNQWQTVPFESSNPDEPGGGIYDVHSNSTEVGLNGKPYNEW